jgi:hypothetical protein
MDPVDSGRLGARRRWGPQRILRIDQLDEVTAGIIRCILTARENAKAAPAIVTPEAAQEVRRDRDELPSAA